MADIRIEAKGLEELRGKVLWLLDHRERYINERRDKWRSVVSEMAGPVTEQTFLVFVE